MSWLDAITQQPLKKSSSPYDLQLNDRVRQTVVEEVVQRVGAGIKQPSARSGTAYFLERVSEVATTVEDFQDAKAALSLVGINPEVSAGVKTGLTAMCDTFGVLAGLRVRAPLPNEVAGVVLDSHKLVIGASIYQDQEQLRRLKQGTMLALRDSNLWPPHLRPIGFEAVKHAEHCGDLFQMRRHMTRMDNEINLLDLKYDNKSRADAQHGRLVREGVQFAFDSLRQSTGLGVARGALPLTKMVAARAWQITHSKDSPFNQPRALPAPRRSS